MADGLFNTSVCLCVRVHCVVLGEQSPGPFVWGWWAGWSRGVTAVIASGKRPVSIPNPVAKLDCADGTALGRVWESRSPPDILVVGCVFLEP